MPSILQYQQSIASEFMALKDRVRFFIEDAHWGEDGRYKELILSDYIKGIVPNGVAVGTGFVRNAEGELTSQLDIVIYKENYPTLFQKGDFVVLMPESVIGIIEVKSKTTHNSLALHNRNTDYGSTIQKCDRNGRIIGNRDIFNGIFGYETDISIRNNNTEFRRQLQVNEGYLNHLCLDSNVFCRYWLDGNPLDRHRDPRPCYSFYDLSWSNIFNVNQTERGGLAFGYFISNLLEYVYREIMPQALNPQYFEFLYPLEGTKERYRFPNCDIKQEIANLQNV
ncbi:MAG: DUF6602 domain-containing protein [Lutisporaceae bacterium]